MSTSQQLNISPKIKGNLGLGIIIMKLYSCVDRCGVTCPRMYKDVYSSDGYKKDLDSRAWTKVQTWYRILRTSFIALFHISIHLLSLAIYRCTIHSSHDLHMSLGQDMTESYSAYMTLYIYIILTGGWHAQSSLKRFVQSMECIFIWCPIRTYYICQIRNLRPGSPPTVATMTTNVGHLTEDRIIAVGRDRR